MARSDPKNSTEYWWDRHLTGLSLMRADFTTHEYPPHIHEALVVAVTENGGSVVKSRGQVEEATPSTLFQLFLLFRYGVATLDRKSFGVIGSEGKHYLRISIATSLEQLEEAVVRIAAAASDREGFRRFVAAGEHLV